MDYSKNLIAPFEITLKYHGTGMPLTIDAILNNLHLHYGPVTEDLTITGSLHFNATTPFFLQISLRDKTYAHTNLEQNTDHYVEITKIRFMDYDIMDHIHESVYYAHKDCEKPNDSNMDVIYGSNILGQNGTLQLGTSMDPFFTWYHKVSHQGTLYELT